MIPPLLQWTPLGLYCEKGDFYIDPNCSATQPVKNAIITHAHSDHARRGAQTYFCVDRGASLLRTRLGPSIRVEEKSYRESWQMGPIKVSLHSAGHILGSAQVRVESDGEIWVASGDYKREADPSCDPFEVVPCDVFITEATFGTPKYLWPKDPEHGKSIYEWWRTNESIGKNSILLGYSLGKTQRVLAELAPFAHRPVLIHSSMDKLTQCYRDQGVRMAMTRTLKESDRPIGELILTPPSALSEKWSKNLTPWEVAFASGWMVNSTSSQYRSDQPIDRGFTLSDHADWDDLHQTIQQTGARRIFVMHRTQGALIRSLKSKGLEAYGVDSLELKTYQRLPQQTLSLFS